MTDPITDAELNMSAEEWMQALAEDPSCIKTYLEAARVRGYRAGLEAAAKEYDAEDLAGVRVYCRHVAQHIRSLPVPGEAPAAPPAEAPDLLAVLDAVRDDLKARGIKIDTVAMLTELYEGRGRSHEEALKMARGEPCAALAAQPEGQAAPGELEELRRYKKNAQERWHKASDQPCRGCGGPRNWSADGQVQVFCISCGEPAAAPGGEDAEALLRECESFARLVKATQVMDDGSIRRAAEALLDRLAARVGGSR